MGDIKKFLNEIDVIDVVDEEDEIIECNDKAIQTKLKSCDFNGELDEIPDLEKWDEDQSDKKKDIILDVFF